MIAANFAFLAMILQREIAVPATRTPSRVRSPGYSSGTSFAFVAGATMAPMQDVQPRVGYADLERMPDDGRRYEIHGGELVVLPSPLPRHQLIVRILDDYIARRGGLVLTAPLDIVLDEFDVVQPDVLFFRAERRRLVQPDAVTRHAPDIVVEVLSPSSTSTDRGRKRWLFARYGVPEYWIVDPVARQIEVHALEEGAYRETQVASGDETVQSVLLPDLTFDAARVFESP